MNKEFVKEKVKIAKELIEGVDEEFKVAAFQVIFSKLLDGSDLKSESSGKLVTKEIAKTTTQVANIEKGKEALAQNCGITVKELDEVISIKDNIIQLTVKLNGTEPEKQIIATTCILTAYEIILGKEWIEASLLSKCVDLSGVSLLNFARTVKNESNLIRTRGKKKFTEYKIAGPGRISAFDAIKKLAKGENPLESKSP